jgi:hypothetical protein
MGGGPGEGEALPRDSVARVSSPHTNRYAHVLEPGMMRGFDFTRDESDAAEQETGKATLATCP